MTVNIIDVIESNTNVLKLVRGFSGLPESFKSALEVQIVLNDVTIEVLKVRGES